MNQRCRRKSFRLLHVSRWPTTRARRVFNRFSNVIYSGHRIVSLVDTTGICNACVVSAVTSSSLMSHQHFIPKIMHFFASLIIWSKHSLVHCHSLPLFLDATAVDLVRRVVKWLGPTNESCVPVPVTSIIFHVFTVSNVNVHYWKATATFCSTSNSSVKKIIHWSWPAGLRSTNAEVPRASAEQKHASHHKCIKRIRQFPLNVSPWDTSVFSITIHYTSHIQQRQRPLNHCSTNPQEWSARRLTNCFDKFRERAEVFFFTSLAFV